MNLSQLISNYSRYNQWANQTMTRWLETLENDSLYKETPSSFSSIDLTLQHMNHAQRFWLAVINEGDVEAAIQNEIIRANAVKEVIDDLLRGAQQMIDTFTAYDEAGLLKDLTTESMTQSRYQYIVHVINHNTHHRGQIITMARCLGIRDNLPSVDYDVFLWHVSNKRTQAI